MAKEPEKQTRSWYFKKMEYISNNSVRLSYMTLAIAGAYSLGEIDNYSKLLYDLRHWFADVFLPQLGY